MTDPDNTATDPLTMPLVDLEGAAPVTRALIEKLYASPQDEEAQGSSEGRRPCGDL